MTRINHAQNSLTRVFHLPLDASLHHELRFLILAMEETASNATQTLGTLETFFHSTRAAPQAVATSQEVRDRGSIFVASLFQVTTPEEAQSRVQYVKCVLHGTKRASHESAAWRCMVVKEGRTGLGGPDDFELKTGSKDDGERWAGDRILKVMQAQAVIDAVVVVSRWYVPSFTPHVELEKKLNLSIGLLIGLVGHF